MRMVVGIGMDLNNPLFTDYKKKAHTSNTRIQLWPFIPSGNHNSRVILISGS